MKGREQLVLRINDTEVRHDGIHVALRGTSMREEVKCKTATNTVRYLNSLVESSLSHLLSHHIPESTSGPTVAPAVLAACAIRPLAAAPGLLLPSSQSLETQCLADPSSWPLLPRVQNAANKAAPRCGHRLDYELHCAKPVIVSVALLATVCLLALACARCATAEGDDEKACIAELRGLEMPYVDGARAEPEL